MNYDQRRPGGSGCGLSIFDFGFDWVTPAPPPLPLLERAAAPPPGFFPSLTSTPLRGALAVAAVGSEMQMTAVTPNIAATRAIARYGIASSFWLESGDVIGFAPTRKTYGTSRICEHLKRTSRIGPVCSTSLGKRA
jgi:hypothetical protein